MTGSADCLCLHPEPLHLLTGRCSVLGCTCTGYEADVCGLPETRHSQHTTYVPGCLSCEDDLADARQIEHDAPWQDV
jgi:hypothetical protein